MPEYLITMAISVLLTTIKMALNDPAKAEQYKKALMKIRLQIDLLFPPEEP